MTNNTKLEGAENFRAWNYRVMLILEEHDLESYINDEVKEPAGDEEKSKHTKDMIKSKSIIDDSIKDHFIPQVYSNNTIKEMFNALTSLFEGRISI